VSTSTVVAVGANRNATVAKGIIWGTFPLRAQCGREPPGPRLCRPSTCRPPRTRTNPDVYKSTMALLALYRKSLPGNRIRDSRRWSRYPKCGTDIPLTLGVGPCGSWPPISPSPAVRGDPITNRDEIDIECERCTPARNAASTPSGHRRYRGIAARSHRRDVPTVEARARQPGSRSRGTRQRMTRAWQAGPHGVR
jgi:hypothetical protein